MNKRIIILTFGLLLIFSFTIPTAFVEEDNLDRNLPVQDNMYLSNEVHNNILILNDTDFVTQAEDEVWLGEGTETSPYYIEEYNISSDLTGIEIHNVSLYFVIQNCYIDSVSVTSNSGIYLKNVTHSEIRNTTVQDKISGIFLYSSNATITENELYDNQHVGIWLEQSDLAIIQDNHISNNSDMGIYLDNSDNCSIVDNEVWENGFWPLMADQGGISIHNSYYSFIEGNSIWNNTEDGIHFDNNAGDSEIVNNVIWGNNRDGIHLNSTGPFVVDGNTMYYNKDHGLYMYLDFSANVTTNLIYNNPIGVEIEEGGSWIYGNDICWNSIDNAIDGTSVGNIYWHDNVSIGNHWSDYSGQGNYNVTTDIAYDIFPKKSLDLILISPEYTEYEISSTGNTLELEAYALHPRDYGFDTNTSFNIKEDWNGGNISLNIDGLSAGWHEVYIRVIHVSGHGLAVYAYVHVIDLTGPEWYIEVQDQEITVGETFSYRVLAQDPSGIAGYAVNDTANFQIVSIGDILNSYITSNTTLDAGVYWLTVTAWDSFNNTVEATFKVTVLPVSTTDDGMVWIFLALGGGVAALLVVVALFIKKR